MWETKKEQAELALFIYLFIYLFICLFIYLFIYLFSLSWITLGEEGRLCMYVA